MPRCCAIGRSLSSLERAGYAMSPPPRGDVAMQKGRGEIRGLCGASDGGD